MELDLHELVRGTADAAFVIDADGSILAWNSAAETLLGYAPREAVGRACHELLCGLDPFGNQFCGEHCAITRMAERNEPVRRFSMTVRRADGSRIEVTASVVHLPGDPPGRGPTMHLLVSGGSPLSIGAARSRAPEAGASRAEQPSLELERLRSLTPREVDVLRLLAAGRASQDVANELSISLTTVRTHIQNILRKLEIHSQIEAVALAYRGGFI